MLSKFRPLLAKSQNFVRYLSVESASVLPTNVDVGSEKFQVKITKIRIFY